MKPMKFCNRLKLWYAKVVVSLSKDKKIVHNLDFADTNNSSAAGPASRLTWMPSAKLLHIADAVIDSAEFDTPSEELVRKLHCIIPENVILAALDLIDCECVIKYTSPQGYPQYEVLGSTATYSVFLDMALAPMPIYCTCPAFSYVVLGSKSHIMCKHILATRLANKLSLVIERPMTPDDLQLMMARQFPDTTMSVDSENEVPEYNARDRKSVV